MVDLNKNPFLAPNTARKTGLAVFAVIAVTSLAVGVGAIIAMLTEKNDEMDDDTDVPFDVPYAAKTQYDATKDAMDKNDDETLNVLILNDYMRLINPKPVVYEDYVPRDVTNGMAMRLTEDYQNTDLTEREWLLKNEDLILKVYFTEEENHVLMKY